MKQYYVLKKLKITLEELNDLVSKHKIIKRYSDNTYLRSDVNKEMRNARSIISSLGDKKPIQ
jgi:hypothetical protein